MNMDCRFQIVLYGSDRSNYVWRSMISQVVRSRCILAMVFSLQIGCVCYLVCLTANPRWRRICVSDHRGPSARKNPLELPALSISPLLTEPSYVIESSCHQSLPSSKFLLCSRFHVSFLFDISYHREVPSRSCPNRFLPSFLAFFILFILSFCPSYPW